MDVGLERMVEEVGSFGPFQFLVIIGAFTSPMLASWSVMFMVFGVLQPDWRCVSRDPLANQSAHSILNDTIANQSVDAIGDNDNRHASFTNEVTTGVSTMEIWRGNDANETDFEDACAMLRAGVCDRVVFDSEMSTIVAEFQLVCDLAWVPFMIISIKSAGILVGGTIAGQLADSVGRKTTMVTFSALQAVFNLIAAFSVSWQMFAVLRALIGITVGGIFVVICSYPTEFIGVTRRGVVMSMPFWGLGTTTLSLLIWALPHWKYVQIITAACSAACLLVWLFLPESVRFLAVKGKVAKAQRVLAKMAKWNKRKPPSLSSVQTMCSEINQTQKKYSYIHLFSTPHMLKITVVTGAMWFICSVSYYGASFGIKNLSGDFNLNFFLMSIVELPLPLLVFHLSGWFGRRWAMFGCFMTCALSAIAFVPLNLLLPEEETGKYVNILCIVCRGVLVLGWAVMNLFVAELFPTVVRNMGLGFCNVTARIAGIVVPYTLSETKPFICYSIIGVLMTLAALAPLLLSETRGRPLQDEIIKPSNHKAVATAEVTNMETRDDLLKMPNQKDADTIADSTFRNKEEMT